jgi:hypothetical protein
MFRRLSTALLCAIAISLLPARADAGVKSGVSFHPTAVPTMHPMPRAPVPHHIGHRPSPFAHDKFAHGFGKFPHHHRHHHRQFLDGGLPFSTGDLPFYGSYYDPADEPGDVDPGLPSGPFPGSFRERAFYRTGCRSEDVSVSSAHGPTQVTVTRCSVPIAGTPALK